MASLLKTGATNVRRIAAVATKKGEEVLEDKDKRIYEAAIKVLLNNLKDANTNSATIRDNLNSYSLTLIGIQKTMASVAARLRNTAAGKSKEFTSWRDTTRIFVYGGCGITALCGPACLIACEATAAAILETEIAKYEKETKAFVEDFTGWAKAFDGLSAMAGKAAAVSKDWYFKIVDYKTAIQSTLELIDGGIETVLFESKDLRDMVDENLSVLIS